jgi:hypothetical protein
MTASEMLKLRNIVIQALVERGGAEFLGAGTLIAGTEPVGEIAVEVNGQQLRITLEVKP